MSAPAQGYGAMSPYAQGLPQKFLCLSCTRQRNIPIREPGDGTHATVTAGSGRRRPCQWKNRSEYPQTPRLHMIGIHVGAATSALRLLRISGITSRSASLANSVLRPDIQMYVSIHSRPIRRLTPQPMDRRRADCLSLTGGVAETDFIDFAVLSTAFFPLKGEVSKHKGIFDER